MLWIISGPSCVGKSTFINSPRCTEITGLPREAPVVFPKSQSLLEKYGATDVFYHYNILRLANQKRWYEKGNLRKGRPGISNVTDFDKDPPWSELTKLEVAKKAVVLVAGRKTILQRARQRRILRGRKYQFGPIGGEVDLVAIYQEWCDELRSRGIPYTLVDSTNDAYPIIESDDLLPIVNDANKQVDTKVQGYTKAHIEQILQERSFRYHRVNLPFGLYTKGADRSATRDLIFPKSLAGKTVLDVGCALGYFCFEAEAKGATRVVGIELKEDRFRDALLLKDIKGSQVEFLQQDVIHDPLHEHFDYILLLNVIHHLKEPFRVIRQLASITRERLIIEFPTLASRRFRKTTNIRFPSLLNRLPLVGVSSLPEGTQTFVFTPSAIKRTLLNHERLFEKVDILRSPVSERAIAVCHKRANSE